MRVPGVKTAKTFTRWVQARLLGGALILGYHRVANVTRDEYEVCVTPKHFAGQMEMLNKYAHPVSLTKLVQYLKEDSLPPQSVAVTFDDGYADNLYLAKPIMEKYEIPATIFVCSGYEGREFWWDELERHVLSSTVDPRQLRLSVGKLPFRENQQVVGREPGQSTDLDRRRRFHQALYHFLLPLNMQEQEEAMDAIRSWAQLSSNGSLAQRSMNHAELLQLAEGGLIEIGSHTRNHPMLSHLSRERQEQEILWGKQDLEALLGKQVAGFSYPNGRATRETKRIVQDLGFKYACTSLQDVVRPGCDIFELTRFWQNNVDGDTFLRGLNLWTKASK